MDESELFGAFDDAPPPPKRARESFVAKAPPPPSQGNDGGLPAAFSHLRHEAIASIHIHGKIADADIMRLEDILRESAPAPCAAKKTCSSTSSTIAAADTIHYFRACCNDSPQPSALAECASSCSFTESYIADFAGLSSVEAVMRTPWPSYDRLPVAAPLPIPPTTISTVSRGGGGRGRGGGRGGGRRGTGIACNGRYFDAAPTASTPGVLSGELRALLGMRDGDPPPWLQMMHRLGYPPGYLHDPNARPIEDTPLVLHIPGGDADGRGAGADQPAPRLVPSVDFPGLNVPPPPGSDPIAWGWVTNGGRR